MPPRVIKKGIGANTAYNFHFREKNKNLKTTMNKMNKMNKEIIKGRLVLEDKTE